jgi:hypothetical protein
MENEFKFADEVWHRVVQIVQEAMLSGVDCADLLRQIRVTENDDGDLVLTAAYQKQVKEMHDKMLEHARELQSVQAGNKFIVPGGNDGNN